MGNELDEFLAHLDELSCDSVSLDQQLIKEKEKNQKMNKILVSLQSSTKDILSIYKNERLITIELQEKLNNTTQAYNTIERQYHELSSKYDNENLLHNQLIEELKQNQEQERQDYIDLSKDYFDLLSETTCFLNYEIKKPQNKIISKAEKLLFNSDTTWKKPKIIRSKRSFDDDDSSTISRVSTRSSKREAAKSKVKSETKRRKTDNIWNLKSISQASSPAPGIPLDYDESCDLSSELCGAESSFSFNTFSIGNETSFSSLQSSNNSSTSPHEATKCRCHLFVENDTVLVSTGTNTDPPDDLLPSVPSLLDDNIVVSTHEVLTEPASPVHEFVPEVSSMFDDKKSNLPEPLIVSSPSSPKQSTLAETEKEDKGTSPEPVITCNKSTATVHSSTTRGTSTIAVVKRNFGVQFPELTMESIFAETIFDLPGFLSPIHDIEDDVVMGEEPKKMTSTETMTELCNVNREIDYLSKLSMKVKAERPSTRNFVDPTNPEDRSFIVLGQTLFDLFVKRMQKSNQLISDDEITRTKIWKHLKRQLVDRFSELSFDETLNGSFSDSEFNEKVPNDVYSCNKEGHEEFAAISEEDTYHEDILKTNPTACSDDEILTTIEEISETFKKLPEIVEELQDEVKELPERVESVKETAELTENVDIQEIIEKDLAISSNSEVSEEISEDFEEIFKSICMSPPKLIEPIDELSDVVWSSLKDSLFPEDNFEAQEIEDCPMVLYGFNIDHEPMEIPIEVEDDNEVEEILKTPETIFTENDTPKSPLPFMIKSQISSDEAINILTEPLSNCIKSAHDSILDFNPKLKSRIIQWKQINKVNGKKADQQLCKARSSIKKYLESDCTDENLDKCVKTISSIDSLFVIKEAIFETVQDNKSQQEISIEFTPPAPPLPPYQLKLILLIKKLSVIHQMLPQKLVEDLEEKLFHFDNLSIDSDELRNAGYYYSALIDLFYDGDPTTVFYFIVQCIYFYGFKSTPIVFVLLKAFPQTIPRKVELLKKNCKDIDWENMTGIDLAKVFFDFECMDSLDLTVVFLINNFQEDEEVAERAKNKKSKKKKKSKVERVEHELFRFFSRYFGYFNNFILRPRLLQVLMKRLDEGHLENLSMSLILLAKRSTFTYSQGTIVNHHLIPLLDKYSSEIITLEEKGYEKPPVLIAKLCLVIETISAIMKTFSDEKDKSIRSIFTKLVIILNRVKNQQVQENCLLAFLRLQRLSDNQKEIFDMIKSYCEDSNKVMNETLQFAIKTFIHRKCERYIKIAK